MNNYEYALTYHNINPLPKPLQSFFGLYMYLTTPTSNTSYLVENRINQGNWVNSFWPIISTFQLKRLFNLSAEKIPIRILPYNTFSLGGVFYFDGGWPLVFFGCFILGCLTYYFYMRSRRSNDLFFASEYFFWGLAMFYSFFSNHFILQAYPLRSLVVFELFRFFFTRRHKTTS